MSWFPQHYSTLDLIFAFFLNINVFIEENLALVDIQIWLVRYLSQLMVNELWLTMSSNKLKLSEMVNLNVLILIL